MVLGVLFKMLSQVLNSFRQQGNLHLTGTGIGIMGFKLLNNLFFLFRRLCHNGPPFVVLLLPGKPLLRPQPPQESGLIRSFMSKPEGRFGEQGKSIYFLS